MSVNKGHRLVGVHNIVDTIACRVIVSQAAKKHQGISELNIGKYMYQFQNIKTHELKLIRAIGRVNALQEGGKACCISDPSEPELYGCASAGIGRNDDDQLQANTGN